MQFSLQDNVQDLRQIVLDRPESCYRTCFSLQIDGVRLDDFAELNMIEGLKDEATIKVVEGMVHYDLITLYKLTTSTLLAVKDCKSATIEVFVIFWFSSVSTVINPCQQSG